MRTTRVTIALACAAIALALPATAAANGGAYIELDETYYVSGQAVSAEAYVYVPDRKTDLLERGPFWLYALPEGVDLREGRPVPSLAVRLGALTVERDRQETYELQGEFTLPRLTPGQYTVAMCNDPCTVSGFGEPLSGSFLFAGSDREVDLLRRNDALIVEVGTLERRLKKAVKTEEELAASLTAAERAREAARAQVASLRAQLDASRTAAAEPVPLIEPWGAATLAGAVVVLSVAIALAVRRRSFAAGDAGVPRP